MRSNDITALHDKTIQELTAQLEELTTQLAQARLQKAAGKLQNTHTALLADDVARVKTVLSIKQKAAQAEAKNSTEEKETE